MFKIGQFSRFARVSVKMLRHYDRIGLLQPAHTDPQTGYRYYSTEQLPRLNRIIALKDMGFSLAEIGGLLAEDLSAAELRGLLKAKRAEIAEAMRAEQARLMMVEARLAEIETEGSPPPYDVVLRKVEAQLAATLRRTIPTLGDHIAEMFATVEQAVTDKRARAAAPPSLIYYDDAYTVDEIDVEVVVPLSQSITLDSPLRVRTVPGLPHAATLIYTGCYEGMQAALTHLYTWVEANGYRPSAPPRDVYLRYNAGGQRGRAAQAFQTEDRARYVTEFQVPVSEAPPVDK